ncbi:MAG: PEP-CTERM sorting domain-containing protein [Verrucomicrobia bacterium]|nr:PEP-CTERM sorting domain-containing protein [Verrucomicrobiota bacterium]MCH8527006.1 PEP-CTERM sorting domain-containing protein [Kiritimatiellia bacterium]
MQITKLCSPPLMRSLKSAATAACIALCAAIPAYGTLIFFDDFEGNTIGSAPAGWTIGGTTASVETAGQSADGAAGDDRGVQLTPTGGSIGTANPRIERSFSQGTNSEPLRIQFDFMYLNSGISNPTIQLRSSDPVQPGINLAMKHAQAGEDGARVNEGSGFVTLNTVIDPDIWYRYTITTNAAEASDNTFDLSIQSLSDSSANYNFTGLGFHNNLTSFSSIRFVYNSTSTTANDTFFIDNVSVSSIPEPSSLILMALAGAGLLVYRNKKRG